MEDTPTGATLRRIPLSMIQPCATQPRKEFDERGLLALADSLKAEGLLQPVLVRPIGGGRYELVHGERRWRAAAIAGWHEIPAIVREMSDREAFLAALAENTQRADLSYRDQTDAILRLRGALFESEQQLASVTKRLEELEKREATLRQILETPNERAQPDAPTALDLPAAPTESQLAAAAASQPPQPEPAAKQPAPEEAPPKPKRTPKRRLGRGITLMYIVGVVVLAGVGIAGGTAIVRSRHVPPPKPPAAKPDIKRPPVPSPEHLKLMAWLAAMKIPAKYAPTDADVKAIVARADVLSGQMGLTMAAGAAAPQKLDLLLADHNGDCRIDLWELQEFHRRLWKARLQAMAQATPAP